MQLPYNIWNIAGKLHSTGKQYTSERPDARHFLGQSEVKPKPIVTCSHAFSRARRLLHVLASNSDWFIGLFTSALIGQSNSFGFDCNRSKPL